MPLYLTNSAAGALDDEAKKKIADDITRIHCSITGAPPIFVHAFFAQGIPDMPLGDKSVLTFGSIRSGRSDAQKADITGQIRHAVSGHTGIPVEAVDVKIFDTPAHWAMEGGEIMPEPGEEAAWLAAHQDRPEAPVA